MPSLFTKFLLCKRFWYKTWLDFSQLFEGRSVLSAVLSTLQSTTYVFSLTTYRIFSFWGYFFTKTWMFTNFVYCIRSTSQNYIQSSFWSCFLCKMRERTVLCTPLQEQAPFLSNSNAAVSVNVSLLEIPHEQCFSPFSLAFLICLASWCAFLFCPQGLQQFAVILLYPFLFFT